MTCTVLHDGKAIRCGECARTSWNPNDITHRYCGFCNKFHDDEAGNIMGIYYTLTADRLPIPCFDLVEWGMWMEHADRLVAYDVFGEGPDQYLVSTVFLGLDHDFFGRGNPLLFETAIFNEESGCEIVDRYTTWGEAAAGHERVRSIAAHQYTESHRLTAALIQRALTTPENH